MSATVAQVFEAAIGAEKAAEALFRGLQTKFAQHKTVAQFWGQYANEETQHARWLEGLRGRLDAETLAGKVDENTEHLLRAVADFSVEKALQGVHNLEEAYQLVHHLENAETNAIFQFLLDNFEPEEEMQVFLRMQLEKHVTKLTLGFPLQYRGTPARQAVKALE